MQYRKRIIDDELDELFPHLPAIALDGPKGVGKTATATQRARTVFRLDDLRSRELLQAAPERIVSAEQPVLIDEWQRLPWLWDIVRRAVDDSGSRGGQFLLTGSAAPLEQPTHSGAGRIVSTRMRPLSLAERDVTTPTVSLGALLAGRAEIGGETSIDANQYASLIVGSGFPAVHGAPESIAVKWLDGYLDSIVNKDFENQGHRARRPEALRAWLRSFAVAVSTDASYTSILDAAVVEGGDKPSRSATEAYRETLRQLWLVDSIQPWAPLEGGLGRLSLSPVHQLADPALAARLMNLTSSKLMSPTAQSQLANGAVFGRLFESLCAQSLQTYAQSNDARVYHLRTQRGDHEIDFIIEGQDGSVVAVEVKLSQSPTDSDVRHLKWLRQKLGDRLADVVVVCTSPWAFRRSDGIAVVPAALLGP